MGLICEGEEQEKGVKIALVYCPALESSGGPAGHELIMPPIGICSLSSYLRENGYPSDLFDLMLQFDTTVLHEDLRRPLADLFDAVRSDKGYDPAVLTNLRFWLGLNRSYLAREVMRLYEDIDRTSQKREKFSANSVRRFFALNAEKLARYDIVGLSIIFEDQNFAALILARWIRSISADTKIVVGGSGAGLDDWKEGANLIIRGDGEPALLSYVRSQDESAKDESRPVPSGNPEVQFHHSLDLLPAPDYQGVFAGHQYLAPVKIIPLAVTRGCYWGRCLFCSFGWREGDSERCTAPYRRMSAARVVADVASQIRENGSRFFFFSVDVADPSLLEEISDELIRTSTEISWSASVRAEKQLLKAGLFQKLFRAGCRSINCGYESFNQRVLDSMQKGIRVEHSRRILDGLRESGVFPSVGYFMGWPGETPEEAAETQDAVNSVFEEVPGTLAERFVLVQDSPVAHLGSQRTWEPLKYDGNQERWLKRGMSWSAQYRQWMIFAANFYCDSKYSCFPVRGDGGYGFLYAARYPLSTLGRMFRVLDSSFGVLGMGRFTFYGFFHTRHYAFESGARFRYDQFMRSCPPACGPAGDTARASKAERLNFAYAFVGAFIGAHDFSAEEQDFIRQVARFDYGLLASCMGEGTLPLVRVDESGELISSPGGDPGKSFVLNFTIDITRVAQFAPLDSVPKNIKCSARFDINGFQVI